MMALSPSASSSVQVSAKFVTMLYMPKPHLAIEALLQTLREIIPGANLETVALNTSVPIELLLLNADYPQGDLCEDDMQRVMNNPLYWIFCWASGQVLAEFLMDNPHWVKNKRALKAGPCLIWKSLLSFATCEFIRPTRLARRKIRNPSQAGIK